MKKECFKTKLMEALPNGSGHWSGERGNSRWIPDGEIVPRNKHYCNLREKTWQQILSDNGCADGIWFTNGEIDFAKTGIVKAEVKIPGGIATCFTEDDLEKGKRVRLYETSVAILAERSGKTVGEIIDWACSNCYICHECSDLETVQFVPQEIHGNVNHYEGIEILKQLSKEIEIKNDEFTEHNSTNATKDEVILKPSFGFIPLVVAAFLTTSFLSLMFRPGGNPENWAGLLGAYVSELFINQLFGLSAFIFVFYLVKLAAKIFTGQSLRPLVEQFPFYLLTSILVSINLNIVYFYYSMDCAEIYIGGEILYNIIVTVTLNNDLFDILVAIIDVIYIGYIPYILEKRSLTNKKEQSNVSDLRISGARYSPQ